MLLLPPPAFLEPSLSRPLTVLSCSLYTCTYVGSLYVFRATRIGGSFKDDKGNLLTRDHPKVIKARLSGVIASTLISLAGTYAIVDRFLLKDSTVDWTQKLAFFGQLVGFRLPNKAVTGLVYPLILTMSLFSGPLYTTYLDGLFPGQANFVYSVDVKDRFRSLIGLRNYLVGPLTEEIVFRSCVIATSVLCFGQSIKALVFASPLYFGIAHAHHAYEVYANNGRTNGALAQGVISAVVQFAYTTLFGWYASFLFVQSTSILPPLIAHIFCNMMGLPQLPLALHNHPKRKIPIWLSYLGGIAAFAAGFSRLTSLHDVFGGSWYRLA